MSIWKLLQLASMTGAFASIVWGALRFFAPPSRGDMRARLVALAAIAGFLNQAVAVCRSTAGPTRTTIAIAAYVMSTALFWGAVRACTHDSLTAIFSEDVPQFMVDRGPYRFIRHPFYASYSVFWLAGWVGTDRWSTGLVAAAMTAIYLRAASLEERKFAESPFALPYARYTAITGFFVPRLFAASHGRSHGAGVTTVR